MQSYWITVQVLRSGDEVGARRIAALGRRVRIQTDQPQLVGGVPADAEDPTRRAYDRVSATWSSTLKPAIARAVAEGAPAATRSSRA